MEGTVKARVWRCVCLVRGAAGCSSIKGFGVLGGEEPQVARAGQVCPTARFKLCFRLDGIFQKMLSKGGEGHNWALHMVCIQRGTPNSLTTH